MVDTTVTIQNEPSVCSYNNTQDGYMLSVEMKVERMKIE